MKREIEEREKRKVKTANQSTRGESQGWKRTIYRKNEAGKGEMKKI